MSDENKTYIIVFIKDLFLACQHLILDMEKKLMKLTLIDLMESMQDGGSIVTLKTGAPLQF